MLRCGHIMGKRISLWGVPFMQKKWKQLLACLAAPLAAGGLSVCG